MSSALRLAPLRSSRLSLASQLRPKSSRPFHVHALAATTLINQKGPRSFQFTSNPSLQQWRHYAEQITIKVPVMAESISEGTLTPWSKEVGEQVEQDEEVVGIETDKVNVAVNAPAAGIIKEILVEANSTVTVGQDLAILELSDKKEGSKGPKKESKPKAEEPSKTEEPAKAEESKPAPQPAAEKAAPPPKPAASAPPSPPPSTQSQGGLGNRGEHREPMSRIRIRTAERLKQSQNTAAALTTFNEVDMSAVISMRAKYKDAILEKTGVKLGFMSFFTKAAILAMRDVPTINAGIEGPNGGDTIVSRDYVDVSIAVATPKGLVTPVIRNAEALDLVGIDKVIGELGEKAKTGRITLEDLAGGTFTISNGGVFGSMMGTPIINTPQTAVLGLHATKERAVVVNGKIEIRPMMYLALTYDHRILDGREAVTFLVKLKEYIEDPRKMLLP